MFLFKRVFFTLLGVLGTLLLDADPAYGLSKEEAIKKCEGRITALEQQKNRCDDKIAVVYMQVLEDLKGLLTDLKKSEEPPKIMSLYTTCQEGLTAMEWIVSRYGKSAKIETVTMPPVVANSAPTKAMATNPAPTDNKAMATNPAPAETQSPATARKANFKKKVGSNLNVLKVKKKIRVKKSKSALVRARHKASKTHRNRARTA